MALEAVGEEGDGERPAERLRMLHPALLHSPASSSRPANGLPSRGDYGLRWGEGAARCFSIESDFDEDESVRLMPIPECFICPMSQTPMEDPVMTVDGCVYERSYIEQWIRHRQQQRLRVTSPATNQELPSHRLVSLSALQKAIEAYLAHRPELRGSLTASRSFEEAAQMLQSDLLEKQAAHVSAEDELSLLRDSNEVLLGALHDAERSCGGLRRELEQVKARASAAEASFQAQKEECKLLQERCDALQESVFALEEKCAADAADEHVGRTPSNGEPDVKKAATSAAVADAVADLTVGGKNCRQRCWHFWSVAFCLSLFALAFNYWVDQDVSSMLGGARRDGDKRREERRERRREDLGLERSRERKAKVKRRDQETDFPWMVDVKEESIVNFLDGESFQGIEEQVAQLRSGMAEDRTQAALVLGIMATASGGNQAAITRAGAVAPLVEMLREDAPEARGQAAVALKALAANSTYNKVAIVRAGAIPVLIRLIQQDDSEVQEVAAACLQCLAETNNQMEIAQAGAIVPLVALLKDERPGIREEAAGALGILALAPDNQVAIAQVGAIPLLVDLLEDEAAQVREQAAAALRNLAAENLDNQVAIARAGAFLPLSELLQDNLQGVREEALAALRNLAGAESEDEEAAEAAAAAGAAMQAAAQAPRT